MNVTPSEPIANWRLRPRDGSPRAVVEIVAQWCWRWRIEIALAYLIVVTIAAALIEFGVL